MMWNGWTQGGCGWWGGGNSLWGLFFSVLLVIGIAVLLGLLIRTLSHRERPAAVQMTQTGLEILNERYVKGEISREEYLQMKKDLG